MPSTARKPATTRTPTGPVAMRQDDWQNINTGLGIQGKSKTLNTVFCARDQLDQTSLEALFQFTWLSARIVSTYPEQMTRKWGACKVEGQDDLGKKLDGRLEELKARKRIKSAMKWARLYGGALVLVGADDGQPVDQPLALERVRRVRYLHVVDKNYATPDTWDTDPDSEGYGQPATYRISSSKARAGESQRIWHASRVLRFDGEELPERLADQNNGWHGSVLDAVFADVRDHAQAMSGAANLAAEFAMSVLKMKNLAADLTMPGGSKLLQERLDQFLLQLRTAGLAPIDADYEEFTRLAHSIAGLPELLEKLLDMAVGASGIPRAILFGQAMGTSRAGADTDVLSFYDRVATAQTSDLVPPMERLMLMLFAELGVPEPEDWAWEPAPLWQLDDKTKAEVHKLVVDAAAKAIESGSVSEVEVRPAVLASGGYEEDEEFTQALADRDPDELVNPDPVVAPATGPGQPGKMPMPDPEHEPDPEDDDAGA